MQTRIAVIGQSGQINDQVLAIAEEVGRFIGLKKGILLTGGRDGIMEAASRGANKAGGLVIGILPGDEPGIANPYVHVPITTGLCFDQRSTILIHSADCVIMLAGGNGTLGELSMAYQNGKDTVVIEGTGGWSDQVRTIAPDGFLDERKSAQIHYVQSARGAVELAFAITGKAEQKAI